MTYPNQRQIYKQMNKLGLWKSYSNVQHKQKNLQKAAIFSFDVEFSFRNVHKRSKCPSKMEYVCLSVCLSVQRREDAGDRAYGLFSLSKKLKDPKLVQSRALTIAWQYHALECELTKQRL